jgi:hypothetical protein
VVEFDGSSSGAFIARFHDGRTKSYGQPNLDRHEKIWQAVDAVRSGEPVACDVHAAMAHTSCVIGRPANPRPGIVDFPPRSASNVELEDEPMIVVEGLFESAGGVLRRRGAAVRSEKHEWARAGRVVELDHVAAPRARAGAVALPA